MPQLRGDYLKEAIKQGIQELASDAGESYVYNATKLAKHIRTSRVSLNKNKDYIDQVLGDINAEKRPRNNQGLIQKLYSKVEELESKNSDLKREINVLRGHHAEIYSRLYMHSVDGEALIASEVQQENVESGQCILCKQTIQKVPDGSSIDNVVQLRKND